MRSAITRLEIATAIKRHGPSTIDEISHHVDASYESTRAQISNMADDGQVEATPDRTTTTGRPPSRWSLTRDGEHLFPKAYNELAGHLLEVLAAEAGTGEDLERILARVVDQKVSAWEATLDGADFEARLEALRSIYSTDDPHISVESGIDGRLRLIERNCPFFDVAQARPQLCGVTLNTVSRVLGRRVVREESFQAGDGRCVFLVTDRRVETPVYVAET